MSASAARLNQQAHELRQAGKLDDARKAYEQALACEPAFAPALNNLGNLMADLGHPVEAERLLRAALDVRPSEAAIHSNLGKLLLEQGRLPQARMSLRKALELNPGLLPAQSNYLLALNYDAAVMPGEAMQAAREIGRFLESAAAARLAAAATQPLTRPLTRPLRLGFVSPDLLNHPVGYFVESFVRFLDPCDIALHAYCTVPLEDELTARIKPHFAIWRTIADLADEAAARIVHADGIDVLVDLAGHTANNRLSLFAWRPAPVHATWLGYFATTGLPSIDWLVADRACVPPEAHPHFTERVAYLPRTRLCFEPPADAPAVARLPALAKGRVTFGSFQNLGKINDAVLSLWGRVLAAVPGSALRLQNAQLGDGAVRDLLRERMRRAGLAADQVSMYGKASRRHYLEAHAAVDIVLDTFPFPGGTTTCEALWMGVPTLTLAGDRMLSRQGVSLLRAANLEGWIAGGEDEYVERAAALAADVPALATLREGLRDHLARTPLFDGRQFARDFAAVMREIASAPAAHAGAGAGR